MSARKQVVRKIQVDKLADFDEHWWPVTLLLLASAGALASYVALTGDFRTPVVRDNAWFHLGVLAAIVAALLIGVALFRGRSQRRMQLGVFLSLLFHAALLFTGRHVYLTYFNPAPSGEEATLDDPVAVTLPDYIPAQQPGEASAELTRPVETELREEKKFEVAPKPKDPVEAKKEAVQEPEPRREPMPTPIELARVELTAPRRAEELAGEKLSRQELPDKLPTVTVPQPRMNRAAESSSQLDAQRLETERRAEADAPDRRLRTREPQPQNRPRPDDAPRHLPRSSVEDQLASIDVRAALRRQSTETMTAPTPADAPTPQARSADAPQPSAGDAAEANRLPATNSVGRPATTPSPTITLAPGFTATAEMSRAETPEPSDSAIAAPTPARSQTASAAGAAAGLESVPIESPTAAAAADSVSPGGAALEAAVASLSRGNQGTPQQLLSQSGGQPSPVGMGVGPTVGSSSIGPRRDSTDGDESAGLASASAVIGRPGRGRSSGAAVAAPAAVADGAMTGTIGPAPRAGNSVEGAPLGLQPIASADGTSLGRRAVVDAGTLLRPSGGMIGGAVGAAPNTGDGIAGAAGTSPSAPRRDLGESTAQAGGSVTGLSSRAKMTPGDALAALPGAGSVAVANVSSPGRTPDAGDAPRAMESTAGVEGLRRNAGGLPVLVAAPEGPGGLTTRPARDLGLPTRRARPESEVVHLDVSRLVPERLGGKRSGGGMVIDTAVVGLKQRDPTRRGELARAMGGSEATEEAVETGLDFLARHQAADGSWRLHDFSNGRPGYEQAGLAQMEADTAGTGLALLAFLGAGYTHQDSKYGAVVEKGLGFLLRRQKPDGDLFVAATGGPQTNTWFYSHGIASIALCEALGMTRDDKLLKGPAQRAIDFIVASQNPEFGGWRYLPRIGSDTSVSGWQLMALKSAERVGLNVPPQTYSLVEKWLNFAQGIDGDPTRYAYRPQAREESPGEDFEHQRRPSRVMTAEALLMRQYLGWNRDHRHLVGGADYLLTELPTLGTAESPDRDAYYWYYGTQVMFHMKGDYWRRWNERLRPILVDSQVRQGPLAGSWDPAGPIPDRWGGAGGRIYVTTMHLLMLEVYYRYLPLYQNLE